MPARHKANSLESKPFLTCGQLHKNKEPSLQSYWDWAWLSFRMKGCHSPFLTKKPTRPDSSCSYHAHTPRQRRNKPSLLPIKLQEAMKGNSPQPKTAPELGGKPVIRLTAVLEVGLWVGLPLLLHLPLLLQDSLLSRNIFVAKVVAMAKHCFPPHHTVVTVNSFVIFLYHYLCATAGMGVKGSVSSANERWTDRQTDKWSAVWMSSEERNRDQVGGSRDPRCSS